MVTLGKNYLIHVNQLFLVSKRFERLQHGLSSVHLERKDRQNVRSAQEIAYKRVQDCLQSIIDGVDGHASDEAVRGTLLLQDCLQSIIDGADGHASDESVRGTLLYLQLVWMYNEIFFSLIASLSKKILYVHFLGIWRNFVHMQPSLDLKTHFITKECYLDSLISCHFAVMLIVIIILIVNAD